MTNKIEQVARAICKQEGDDPDHICSSLRGDAAWRMWTEYQESAKAAIEAMREPTDGMRAAVAAQWGRKTWGYYDNVIDAALEVRR